MSKNELLLLCSLCAVLGTALVTVCNALCVKRTADDVVTHTGKVSYTASSDENYRVLLQVVSDTGNINGCLKSVGQSYSGDLSHCRVRLLRAGRGDLGANASLLRCGLVDGCVLQRVEALLENRRLGFVDLFTATLSDKLVKGWHFFSFPPSSKI